MSLRPSLEEPIPAPAEDRGPPLRELGPREWARQNLFGSAGSSVATVVFGLILGYAAFRGIRFLFVTARWEVVRANLTSYLVGDFPRNELWRPWAALYLLTLAAGVRWGIGARRRLLAGDREVASIRGPARRIWPLAVFAVAVLALSWSVLPALLIGGLVVGAFSARWLGTRLSPRLARFAPLVILTGVVAAFVVVTLFDGVSFINWRGLLLTIFFAVGGILLSFPFGVLLALGRRSSFPAIRTVCVGYIELIRGVPLITLLFMSFLVISFFLPPGASEPSRVTRALVAFVLFTAAYVAEVVRGGLQSVPRGQVEAAQALGLKPVRITAFIVLPQALRNVIPALVGQFISLFKDTSLATFIGLTELLGVAQVVTSQPRFLGQGLQAESLGFAAFIFWVGAYWMSKSSQRLEKRLGVGER